MATRLFTAKEVGRRLGVPETKVRAEARAGRFPHHKIGRYRRFSDDQVDAYLALTRVETDPVTAGRIRRGLGGAA
jgi:excisionase family DNA binding protein